MVKTPLTTLPCQRAVRWYKRHQKNSVHVLVAFSLLHLGLLHTQLMMLRFILTLNIWGGGELGHAMKILCEKCPRSQNDITALIKQIFLFDNLKTRERIYAGISR